MIDVPLEFRPKINTVYPQNNFQIFEEWLYNQQPFNTEREYLGVQWTAYFVNHSYGNDYAALNRLQQYIDGLPRDKKYWAVVQYDDSILVDFNGLDILQFNMSESYDYPLPLLMQPHPYKFDEDRNILFSFIGSRTHPIREKVFSLSGDDIIISDKPHNIETYCKVLSKSLFGLCPRGYGKNSFRVQESIQYGAIPVYISDEFVFPHNLDFNEFGVVIEEKDVHRTREILNSISDYEIIQKQDKLKYIFENYYTYEANLRLILQHLKNETSIHSSNT